MGNLPEIKNLVSCILYYKQYFNLSAVENLQFKCITEETAIKAIDELKTRVALVMMENLISS